MGSLVNFRSEKKQATESVRGKTNSEMQLPLFVVQFVTSLTPIFFACRALLGRNDPKPVFLILRHSLFTAPCVDKSRHTATERSRDG